MGYIIQDGQGLSCGNKKSPNHSGLTLKAFLVYTKSSLEQLYSFGDLGPSHGPLSPLMAASSPPKGKSKGEHYAMLF